MRKLMYSERSDNWIEEQQGDNPMVAKVARFFAMVTIFFGGMAIGLAIVF